MSYEESAEMKQGEYCDGDCKIKKNGNHNGEKISISVNGNIEMGKASSVAKNAEDEEKGLTGGDVCRDFLNNMCNRGSRCKFYHPPNIVRQRATQQTQDDIEYQFCIDYQNRGCYRDNCRYIHAHREDVGRYKMTGEVTLNLAREIAAVHNCDTICGIPFCKEYQIGSCSRGRQRCRYWHINVEEERERRRRAPHGMPASMLPPLVRGVGLTLSFPAYHDRRSHPYSAADVYAAHGKRVRYNLDEDYMRDLERRNAELSKEVEGLKRELARERERYSDLYALFRERTIITTAQHDSTDTIPATSAYYQSTSWTDTQWTH